MHVGIISFLSKTSDFQEGKIQNQTSTEVNSEWPSATNLTCNDGVQNQNETGIDCGGPCDPCCKSIHS